MFKNDTKAYLFVDLGMDELEWTIVRKNSQILEYICYKNFISKD